MFDPIKIGLVSISDRASTGVYEDKGIPALQEWLASAIQNPVTYATRLIADEQPTIESTLVELCDVKRCDVVLTTGGTGPARRDVTPEATLAVAHKEMPGFGEQMRQISLNFVPTAILSRQVAVIRGKTLIINLPGQPKTASHWCMAFSRRCRTASISSAAGTSKPTTRCAKLSARRTRCVFGRKNCVCS